MSPTLSSAESWGLCDPHELFLERAARVEPGGERAFIEAQIEAFGNRAHALEEEARRWSCEVAPLPKGNNILDAPKHFDKAETCVVSQVVSLISAKSGWNGHTSPGPS
jgi:hypothetical protein